MREAKTNTRRKGKRRKGRVGVVVVKPLPLAEDAAEFVEIVVIFVAAAIAMIDLLH